jgi:hypothetical protein
VREVLGRLSFKLSTSFQLLLKGRGNGDSRDFGELISTILTRRTGQLTHGQNL